MTRQPRYGYGPTVMAGWAIATGLDPVVGPAIHALRCYSQKKDVDGGARPRHDGEGRAASVAEPTTFRDHA
jgi:hypothetical protein